MSTFTVLITGASGLLGSTLALAWRDRFRVVAASRSKRAPCSNSWRGDLTALGAVDDLLASSAPNVVVHTAALTDVDACEANPELSMKVNAEMTGRLALTAHRMGASFVYISTEGVFDGIRGNYQEADIPMPINQYGLSKLAGEAEALKFHPSAVIVRIGLEGWRMSGKPGFVQWVVEGLRRREERMICTDWIHTVVVAPNLTKILESLWLAGEPGIYHVGARQPASNWEIAQAAAMEFDLDASLLIPIKSDSLSLKTIRPKNVSLNCEKLRERLGPDVVWDLYRGIAAMRQQEVSGELASLRGEVLS